MMAAADFPRPTTPNAPAAPLADPSAALLRGLNRLRSRRNTQLVTRSLVLSAALGLLPAAAMVFAYRLYLVDGEPWMPAIPIALALLWGAWRGLKARRGLFDVALDADRSLGLKEHLSSALAFARPELVTRAPGIRTARAPFAARLRAWPQRVMRGFKFQGATAPMVAVAPTGWVPMLVRDAAGKASGLEPRRVYPWKWERRQMGLFAALLLFTGVCLMPNLNWLRTVQQRKEALALQKPGEELQQIAKKVQQDQKLPNDAKAKALARKLQALGRKMARGRMGKRDALVAMAQLKRDLQRSSKPSEGQKAGDDFSKAEQALREQAPMESAEGRKMQEALKQGDLEKAAQQLDALAKKLEQGNMTPQEKQKAANDLQKAADALRKQGGAANETAAKQLEQAAQQMKQGNQQQGAQGKPGQQQQQQQGGQQKPGQKGQSSQGGQGQKQGQQQSGKSGQQGGAQSGAPKGGQGQQGAGALRQMAQGLRGSQMGNSQALQNMLGKIREAEQQAGQNSGQQSGSGQGKGTQAGNGGDSRQNMTPGKNLMPTDPHGQVGGGAGLGQRSHATGSKSGGGVSKAKSNRTGDKRRWADVWSDRLPKTRKRIDKVTGKLGSDGEMEQLPTQTEAQGGPVNTPYYDVYESYKKDAEDAVSKEQVPPAYRAPVKNYFESLKP